MKLNQKQYIGQIGENVACKFLKKRGFKIVDRNYRKKWGEIDIVSLKDKEIHFVEVKTVSRDIDLDVLNETDPKRFCHSGTYEVKNDEYRAEENVHPWKIKRLNRAIESYLEEKKVSDDTNWTLDLVVVYLDLEGKKARVDYLENIF